MLILVTGSNGQLGKSLKCLIGQINLNHEFVFVTREQLDLTNFNNVRNLIEKNKFDIIINCAAYTSVDKAETEKKQANLINHVSVRNLAEIARDNNIKLIHISTDFVFDGSKIESYDESDAVSPLNIYGKTKLDGENAIFSTMQYNALIIRTSWVYSIYGNNFVDTILKLCRVKDELNVISDQIGSPTFADDIASSILSIIDNKKFNESHQESQIFHYSNEGKCSWYEFANEINRLSGSECKINPIYSKDYSQAAVRPKQVILNKTKIIDFFDLDLIFWKDSLKKCIQVLSANSN
jgi:dTDP-4-dehydrorhamnose reductase